MYKISVPVMNSNVKRSNREKLLEELKLFDAECVFLALDTYETDSDKRKQLIAELKDNCRFFKDNGFKVGAWIWAFWIKENKTFRNMRSIHGTEIKKFMCPSDEGFVAFAGDYVKDIASCGVDLIMFDDDFRYSFFAESPGCLCDWHISEINGIAGGNLTREAIKERIINGTPNVYRDAYLRANGDALRNFAQSMRNAVDEVNPQIRMGACSCMSSWDVDGTDAYEIAKILAGGTKPFVRLIGAPYWAVNRSWGNNLQDVVELERMESSWTKRDDIEIMAEGDVYPRPRTLCSSSYLEGFDTAIRAAGCTDGILKYGIDYISNADYETGYRKSHVKNRGIYSEIEKMFSNKTSCGVRVYESMKKISDMVLPTKVNDTVNIQDLFFSKAARTLAYNSIPTVYEGNGVSGIVFDENARNMPLEALENGLIIDIAAAEILMERGIDVGIYEIGNTVKTSEEIFIYNNNRINTRGAIAYLLSLHENVEVLSYFETDEGKIPLSFRYENQKGNRFLVLNINTRSENDNPLKNYERSRQYAQQIEWLGGKKLPAYCYGNPALYIQCKKKDDLMAVGLWNFFADAVQDTVVELDNEYSQIRFVNCNGKLEGNKVYLNNIPAFEFAFFEVKI